MIYWFLSSAVNIGTVKSLAANTGCSRKKIAHDKIFRVPLNVAKNHLELSEDTPAFVYSRPRSPRCYNLHKRVVCITPLGRKAPFVIPSDTSWSDCGASLSYVTCGRVLRWVFPLNKCLIFIYHYHHNILKSLSDCFGNNLG